MKSMFKKMIRIALTVAFVTILFACSNSQSTISYDISTKSAITTELQSELAKDYKMLFEKDFIKSHLNGRKISELALTVVKSIKSSDKEKAKSIVKEYGDLMSYDNFVDDNSTYNWLANITVKIIKESLNAGNFPYDMIDQINSASAFLGIKKISIDINKRDYTDKDAEGIALNLYPLVDKFLNKEILKNIGIDLDDPNLAQKLVDQITFENDLEGVFVLD